jgi:hypothetical protein
VATRTRGFARDRLCRLADAVIALVPGASFRQVVRVAEPPAPTQHSDVTQRKRCNMRAAAAVAGMPRGRTACFRTVSLAGGWLRGLALLVAAAARPAMAQSCYGHSPCPSSHFCEDNWGQGTCADCNGATSCNPSTSIDGSCGVCHSSAATQCVMETFTCVYDATCMDHLYACSYGCDTSLEPMRADGCCDNSACEALHDCMVRSAPYSTIGEPTCAEWRDGFGFGIAIVMLLLVLIFIGSIVACVCCCTSKTEVQRSTVIVQPPPPQQQQQQQQQPWTVGEDGTIVVNAMPVTAPQLVNITVPAGVSGGQVIQVQAPSGQVVQVQVPPGMGAGSVFVVQC